MYMYDIKVMSLLVIMFDRCIARRGWRQMSRSKGIRKRIVSSSFVRQALLNDTSISVKY